MTCDGWLPEGEKGEVHISQRRVTVTKQLGQPSPISCDDTKSRQAGNQWTYEGAPQEEVGASEGGVMRGAGESSRRNLLRNSYKFIV